jgi:hypothetical protein
MTAAIIDVISDKMGDPNTPPPPLYGLPVAANVQIFGGTFAANDVNGRAVPCTSAAALQLWGRVERQINNLTTNTPWGAAGSQNVLIAPGAYYFSSDGTVTAGMIGQAVFALDDNTVTTNPTKTGVTYWLPYAGYVVPPAVGDFGFTPNNATKVPVFVGAQSPTSVVLHATIDIPLATMQALTSGTAFNVGPVLPANARVLSTAVNVITVLAGNTSDVITLQGGTDAAGTLIASTTVFTGAAAIIQTPGSNPYATRGGTQLKATITGGTALSNLTTGHLSIDVFYSITP